MGERAIHEPDLNLTKEELVAELRALRAENAGLKQSEELLRTVVDGIDEAVYAKDERSRFLLVNSTVARRLGRPAAVILGKSLVDLSPTESARRTMEDDRDIMGKGVARSYEEVFAFGGVNQTVLTTKTPFRDESGRVVGLVGISRDITERRRNEEAIEESQRRFRAIFENSLDWFLLADDSGRYIEVNPAACQGLGYSRDEFLRLSISDLTSVDSRPRFPEHMSRFLLAGTMSGEYTILCKDRTTREVEYRAVANILPGRHLSILRDVTDRKRAEDALRLYAERLADLSRRLIRAEEAERRRIAVELHDEIGQALTALKLNLKTVIRRPDSPATPQRLEESVGLVERTISQVRDLSLDLRPALLDDLGLIPALRSYVGGLARWSSIEAAFVADEENGRHDPEIETACFRIAQEALTNVARHSQARTVRVEIARSESELRLLIADDGAGFDVATAIARAADGASLGLLGMRERASLLGGDVEIASEPGRGTEVRAAFRLRPAGHGPVGGRP
jgi:PAS domain S-box-containing protein